MGLERVVDSVYFEDEGGYIGLRTVWGKEASDIFSVGLGGGCGLL